jgi:hypothetical protein
MKIDTLSLRGNLKSLEGLNEWSLDDRDYLIQLLLAILDGLDDVAADLTHFGENQATTLNSATIRPDQTK